MDKLKDQQIKSQHELIMSCFGLVYHLSRKLKNRYIDEEDMIGIASVEMVRAANRYQVGTASFPTYAHRCIYFRLLNQIKAAKAKKHISLDASISYLPPIEQSAEGVQDIYMALQECNFNDSEKEVIRLILEDYKVTEIAMMKGCSKQRISQVWSKARKKFVYE